MHLHPLEPWVLYIFCTVEMLFSIKPGSWLGFALTVADWGSLLRDLDKPELQTKKLLREAGRRSFVIQSLFFTVGLLAAWSNGRFTAIEFFLMLAVAVAGLATGYLILLRVTRSGGWYGLD